jgi:hypothetical protein
MLTVKGTANFEINLNMALSSADNILFMLPG